MNGQSWHVARLTGRPLGVSAEEFAPPCNICVMGGNWQLHWLNRAVCQLAHMATLQSGVNSYSAGGR
eukprot:15437001-Alexandrium_andersonii.AAC.1